MGDLVGVQRHAHHRAAALALLVKPVERLFDHRPVAPRLDLVDDVGDGVVQLQRIRHRDERLAGTHPHRRRLIVVEEVAGVDAAGLAEQIQAALGVRQRRRQIAGAGLAGMLGDGVHGVLDHAAFLGFVHAVGVARVVDAVAEELPAARLAHLDDLRVVFAKRHREAHRAAHAVLVQQFHHAHVADAVAVVPRRVGLHVRRRPRPRPPMRIGRRIQFVELDVRRHPERQLGAAGPADGGPLVPSAVGVEVEILLHRGAARSRCPAPRGWAGSRDAPRTKRGRSRTVPRPRT